MFEITHIYYYPVKSLGAISVQKAIINDFGIQNDRRFMLVDEKGKFVSQRTFPQLSLLTASLTPDNLFIVGDELGSLSFELGEFSGSHKIGIWSDSVEAKLIDNELTQQLSDYLGIKVRIAYMPDSSFRQVDRKYFLRDQRVSFVDGFPFLLTNQFSLDDLNGRLSDSVEMKRFRPNVVFAGDNSFQEDSWKRIKIGELEFELVKPCSRCVMTTINNKAEKGREPLLTLSRYRKNEFGVCFGQNMVHLEEGAIKVGDTLTVLK